MCLALFFCTQLSSAVLVSAAIPKTTPILLADLTNKAIHLSKVVTQTGTTYQDCLDRCNKAYPRVHPRPQGTIPLGECIQHCWNKFVAQNNTSPH